MKTQKKILVTGGTGYIGSHTLIDLVENGYSPISIDNGCNSDASVLEFVKVITGRDIIHFEGDLRSYDIVRKVFTQHPDIEGVIHFAALKSVNDSVMQPYTYFDNNINALLNVIKGCLENNVTAFVFSSSCTVYGDVKKSPVDENTPWQDAASPYGRTKQIGEHILMDTFKNSSVKSIALRYFNPAGAHPSGLIGESPTNIAQNLIPVITETAIGKRKSMTVFGNDYNTRDGSCIRDYIHVMDLAHAHILALDYIFRNEIVQNYEVFNLGIGEGLTVLELIEAFENETHQKLNYIIGPRRPGDVEAIYADPSKAMKLLDWIPKYTVADLVNSAWLWEKNRSK